jgi:hypothetical protein
VRRRARARRGFVETREDLDERRLARTVLPKQPMHFPGADGQIDAAERVYAAELLGEVTNL